MKRILIGASVALGIAVLSACAPRPAPVTPPPEVVRIPPRPYPPMGAMPNMNLPPRAADGTRLTINSGLSQKQTVWSLRSAYNVAALNCQKPEHAAILANYADFLKANKGVLASINRDLDKQYKAQYGSAYIHKRETFQTQVYNYFALPPVIPAFCDAALSVGQDLRSIPSSQLETYAATALAKLDGVFQDFFAQYERYRVDLAAWEARYGANATTIPFVASGQGLAQ